MIPMKEARMHLYKMYKDKYVTYQEIPRRDHNPETTIFLWCINHGTADNTKHVISDAFKSLLNLKIRRQVEIAKNSDLLFDLDSQLASNVGTAQQLKFRLDQLDRTIAGICKMIRLFS